MYYKLKTTITLFFQTNRLTHICSVSVCIMIFHDADDAEKEESCGTSEDDEESFDEQLHSLQIETLKQKQQQNSSNIQRKRKKIRKPLQVNLTCLNYFIKIAV